MLERLGAAQLSVLAFWEGSEVGTGSCSAAGAALHRG